MNKILFFLLITFSSYSQVNQGFYLTAGLNANQFKSTDLISSMGTGYKGGIVFCVGENENENFQLELMYSNSVFSSKTINKETFDDVQDTKFNYASLDLGLYYNFYFFPVDEDEFYIGAQAGLTVGLASAIEPATENRYILPNLIDANNAFSELPPITLSPGAGITAGYNDFRLGLRYNHGLTNIMKFTETDSRDESNRYTGPSFKGTLSSVSLTLSYNL